MNPFTVYVTWLSDRYKHWRGFSHLEKREPFISVVTNQWDQNDITHQAFTTQVSIWPKLRVQKQTQVIAIVVELVLTVVGVCKFYALTRKLGMQMCIDSVIKSREWVSYLDCRGYVPLLDKIKESKKTTSLIQFFVLFTLRRH